MTEAQRLEAADPTLPTTTITINDVAYRMCFDLASLAEGEHEINRKLAYEQQIDILDALPRLNLFNTRILFACAVRRFQPEIAFEDAKALPTLPAVYAAREALNRLWVESLAEPTVEENPTLASSSLGVESSAGLTSGPSAESVSSSAPESSGG